MSAHLIKRDCTYVMDDGVHTINESTLRILGIVLSCGLDDHTPYAAVIKGRQRRYTQNQLLLDGVAPGDPEACIQPPPMDCRQEAQVVAHESEVVDEMTHALPGFGQFVTRHTDLEDRFQKKVSVAV